MVLFLVIGILAGWIAGTLMEGRGFGLLGNMVVGVLGAVAGGYLFKPAGVAKDGSFIGSLVTAIAGAIVPLFVIGLIKKA